MLESVLALLAAIRVFFRSRSDTALEVLALRQQVAVLKRKLPRPHLNSLDRLFWTILLQLWSRWAEVLVIVTCHYRKLRPDTQTSIDRIDQVMQCQRSCVNRLRSHHKE